MSLSPLFVSPIYLVYPGGSYRLTATLFVIADLPEEPEAPATAYSKQYHPSVHLNCNSKVGSNTIIHFGLEQQHVMNH